MRAQQQLRVTDVLLPCCLLLALHLLAYSCAPAARTSAGVIAGA